MAHLDLLRMTSCNVLGNSRAGVLATRTGRVELTPHGVELPWNRVSLVGLGRVTLRWAKPRLEYDHRQIEKQHPAISVGSNNAWLL